MKRKANKLLLVGWDSADWKVINPLMDKGLMPALEKIVNNGVIGNIATLDPPLSPMLWTSIATGMTADKHGILNFAEPHPDRAEVRPVTSTSRKVKAFWNILNQNNLKCNVIGWWPSNPAEPINGAMVSNLYQKCAVKPNEEWKLNAGTVHPESLHDVMKDIRIRSIELTPAHIQPFIPNLEAALANRDKDDKLVEALMGLVAECSTIHNAATYLIENTEWDVTAVYYDAIDVCSHFFMKFHPPQLPGIPDKYYENYKDVVASMYRYHDMMLERLLDLVDEDTTVMILSDHGFHSDELRPKTLPNEPDAPALEHRNFGIVGMMGPGIKKDERIYGATLLDIAPTILDLFGLPIGNDMDGKVLASAFEKETKPEFIESWEKVEGDTGMHSEELMEDPIAAQEALKQLVELGYIEAPGADAEFNVRRLIASSQFNLARVFIHSRKFAEALPILEKLHNDYPTVARYGYRYATCLQKLRRTEDCRNVIAGLRVKNKKDQPQLDLMEASLLLSEKKPHQALERLKNAEKSISHMPSLYVQLGSIYNSIHQWNDSIRSFTKALELDRENPAAYTGRGIAYYKSGNFENAVEDLLDSTGLLFHQPHAHYYLGEALLNIGEPERAAEAFKICISMEPGYRRAYVWLVKIYTEMIPDKQKADYYREFMDKHIQGTITIVSGLPRSGTSMMMQMLKEGGMEVLTDDKKTADRFNSNGYFEFEPVQKLSSEKKWLEAAIDKVVKIHTPILHFLPPKYQYKIIYMKRDLNEIYKSEQKVLGKSTSDFNLTMADLFVKQEEKCMTWMKSQPNVEIIFIDYEKTLDNPNETASKVAAFLDKDLLPDKMAECVKVDINSKI